MFNEIKLRARNAFPDDDELKITKDESKMLQTMIDEHLKSNGIHSLLSEPISIIDKDKFKEEIMQRITSNQRVKDAKQLETCH